MEVQQRAKWKERWGVGVLGDWLGLSFQGVSKVFNEGLGRDDDTPVSESCIFLGLKRNGDTPSALFASALYDHL